jgi:hypothetical protein
MDFPNIKKGKQKGQTKMTKLHLNYDGKQNNGIIFNATYQGAMFAGAEFRPVLSFEFDSFMFSEVFDHPDYVIQLDGIKRLMTDVEKAEIVTVATNWVQPLGQEGNPTQFQLDAQALANWKESRRLAVESIEVIYDQVVYQGDEVSQGRMSRSIAALPDDVMTVPWVAKDNSVQFLNKIQLKAILLDAGAKQSAIWNEGRP